MNPVVLQSALRLLIHARNSHGALRATVRALIHADIAQLRSYAGISYARRPE